MGREVSLVIFTILLLLVPIVSAAGEDLASINLDFSGLDLECGVEYFDSGLETTGSYQWINQKGIMSVPNEPILERIFFTRDDTIICKYRDVANGISVQDKLKIRNTAPVLDFIKDKEITQGNILQLNPSASDTDGDALTFSYTFPLDDEGRWDDTIQFSPGKYEIVVTVDDGLGGQDSQNVRINLLDKFGDQKEVIERKKKENSELSQEIRKLREARANKQFVSISAGKVSRFLIDNENIPFTEMIFTTKTNVLNADLELQVLLEKPFSLPLPLEIGEEVLDYILVRETGLDDLSSVTIKFRISKQELYGMKIPTHAITLKKLEKNTWVSLKTRTVGSDEKYQLYVSDTPGFNYFAITGKIREENAPVITSDIIGDQVVSRSNDDDLSDAKVIEVVDETDTFENWTALIAGFIIVLVVTVFIVMFLLSQKKYDKIKLNEEVEYVQRFEEEKVSERERLKGQVNHVLQRTRDLIDAKRLREARNGIKELQELSKKLEGAEREVVLTNILKLRKLMMRIIEESI